MHGQWGPPRPTCSAWTPNPGSFIKSAEGKIPQHRATPLRDPALTLDLLAFQFLLEKTSDSLVPSHFPSPALPVRLSHGEAGNVWEAGGHEEWQPEPPGTDSPCTAVDGGHCHHLSSQQPGRISHPSSSPTREERGPAAHRGETLRPVRL